MINDATMEENKLFCTVLVGDHDLNQGCAPPLTKKTIELVLPIKPSTRFLSLISASDPYSFQYEADVSPYLGALIALSQR
jgi:hypothetical protein